MKSPFIRSLVIISSFILTQSAIAATVTPTQYFTNAPKPHFKTNHRLPPLSQFWPRVDAYYCTDLNTMLSLIPFGYALNMGPYMSQGYVQQQMSNTNSLFYKCVQLNKANPVPCASIISIK